MTALPLATAFTDSAVTEGDFKTAITDQRDYLAGLFGTDGTVAIALATLGSLGADTVAKTSNYTVLTSDRGKVILCSGTFTLSLTAAATLADGFNFAVINTGTGTITIDPNSTEQIDGANTKDIAAGGWAVVTCTGSAFWTMGTVPATGSLIGYQVFTASGTYTKSTNNPSFVIVEVQGGGGSGSGHNGSNVPQNGNAGGTSSFGAHCSATGGGGGVFGTAYTIPAGGAGASGDLNLTGAVPYMQSSASSTWNGGTGAASTFGGNGRGKIATSVSSGNGNSAVANSGSGGGAATGSNPNMTGGSAGGYSRKKILATSLGASETVTIGAGGASTTGFSGNNISGAGGSGIVIVWEYR